MLYYMLTIFVLDAASIVLLCIFLLNLVDRPWFEVTPAVSLNLLSLEIVQFSLILNFLFDVIVCDAEVIISSLYWYGCPPKMRNAQFSLLCYSKI